jgi:hypothetical protein
MRYVFNFKRNLLIRFRSWNVPPPKTHALSFGSWVSLQQDKTDFDRRRGPVAIAGKPETQKRIFASAKLPAMITGIVCAPDRTYRPASRAGITGGRQGASSEGPAKSELNDFVCPRDPVRHNRTARKNIIEIARYRFRPMIAFQSQALCFLLES